MVLTDFAPHKPVAIPDDDTTTFHYFFDSMARRRCYIAPERFYTSGRKLKSAKASASLDKGDEEEEEEDGDRGGTGSNSGSSSNKYPPPSADKRGEQLLTPAMDVFSLGCTIAEVLLDGECLIDLPSLLQYLSMCRSGKKEGKPHTCLSDDDSPALATLNRIKDPRIRKTISLMTQFAPSDRLSVSAYRQILEDKGVFPSFFSSVLYDLFLKVHWHGTTPDDRVNIICENYSAVMTDVADCEDAAGSLFFTNVLKFLLKGAPCSASSASSSLMLDRTVNLHAAVPEPSAAFLAASFASTRSSRVLDGHGDGDGDDSSGVGSRPCPRPLHSSKVDLPPGLAAAAAGTDAGGARGGSGGSDSTHAATDLLKKMRSATAGEGGDTPAASSTPSMMSLINDFEKLLRSESKEKSKRNGSGDSEQESGENGNEKGGEGQGQGQEKGAAAQYSDRVFVEEDTKLFDFQDLSQRRPK